MRIARHQIPPSVRSRLSGRALGCDLAGLIVCPATRSIRLESLNASQRGCGCTRRSVPEISGYHPIRFYVLMVEETRNKKAADCS